MANESFSDRLERSDEVSGPIVAERVFDIGGRTEALRVRLRVPCHDADTGNSWCTLELTGSPETTRFKLWGVDSLQALQLAIRAAGEILREMGSTVTWNGEEDLGFPRSYPSYLSASASSRIERLIDQEIARDGQSKRDAPSDP